MIEPKVAELGIAQEIGHAVLVEADGVGFGGASGTDKWQEGFLSEILERRHWVLFTDADLALCKGRFVCSLHLFRKALVRLLRALTNQLAVPGELVPPVAGILLLVDHDCEPPNRRFDVSRIRPSCLLRQRFRPPLLSFRPTLARSRDPLLRRRANRFPKVLHHQEQLVGIDRRFRELKVLIEATGCVVNRVNQHRTDSDDISRFFNAR